MSSFHIHMEGCSRLDFVPLVSIVIPVFNGSDYLKESIDSALAQTYKNAEIIVVNDGSQDGGATEQIALSYGEKIRYFSKCNGGVASALNHAIERMSGDYFSWLSHDDLYVPTKLERQVGLLSKLTSEDRASVIVYSDYSVFCTDPAQDTVFHMKGVPPEHFRHWITTENSLHGCTLMIPRLAFEAGGRFDESLRTTQDYDLWFRLSRNYRFVHLPEVLVKARSHAEQGSIKMSAIAQRECEALLSGFVGELSPTELAEATGQSPAESYRGLMNNMSSRGFPSTSRMVMRCWLRNFPASSVGGCEVFRSILLDYFHDCFGRLSRLLHLLKRR